jgi:hypothetical protein
MEDVNGAQVGDDAPDGLRDTVGISDVAVVEPAFAPGTRALGRDLFPFLGAHVQHGDARALGGEAEGARTADAV